MPTRRIDKKRRPPSKTTGAKRSATRRNLASRTLDARRDTLDFRDQMFQPTLREVPNALPLSTYLKAGVPVLDQGTEGACTGFGLATVVHYLLRSRRVGVNRTQVSPWMLYDLARRYDEWPGEAYSGSSARGAMKGWHQHGVCARNLWPAAAKNGVGLTHPRLADARGRPLGAYFRVNHLDIVAIHLALVEVGILFATANVHGGWDDVPRSGSIRMQQTIVGAHAFAIVGFDDRGFWIQNSWGKPWGKGGFGHLSYDDWLANGTDLWVARLAVPIRLSAAASDATATSARAGSYEGYSIADLRPHIVSIGNDGRPKEQGPYATTEAEIRALFRDDLPRITADWSRKKVLLYAHGGLVDERAAVQRLAEYRRLMLKHEIYPISFIWNSDLWTTLGNIIRDAFSRRRAEGVIDDAKNFLLDRIDDFLEPTVRALGGRIVWKEMKENAEAASTRADGAARIAAEELATWLAANQVAEVHVVSHSAGSVFMGRLVQLLTSSRDNDSRRNPGPGLGIPIDSMTFWAPACTTQYFRSAFLPAFKSGAIRRGRLVQLTDQTEQDDHCARIYNKSLLYLVSNALEDSRHTPLLGLQRYVTHELEKFPEAGENVDLLEVFDPNKPGALLLSPNSELPDSGLRCEAREHGAFDDDEATLMSTLSFILGTTLPKQERTRPAFEASRQALRNKRLNIEDAVGLIPVGLK